MGWKFTGDKPIHVQLVNEISNRIVKGEYVPGMKLPSVRDFAAQASVNPNTMQRALSALESGGLIFLLSTPMGLPFMQGRTFKISFLPWRSLAIQKMTPFLWRMS